MSDITQVEVGGTTYDIVDDKAQIENLSLVECSTARSTAAKVVTLNGFTLKTGARILVRFTNTGSSNPSSGNLTLKVGSSDAKTIVDGHTNKTVMTYSNAGYFYNNYVAEFVYDGTYWVWLNRDTNTTYTGATLKTNAAKTGSGTTITDTIAASTTMDNSIGTLLNNDVALNTNKAEKSAVANKADLASINITSGTTNNTGAKINSGTYFYYNGTFVRAKTDIANGATLTLNTNYEVVSVGTVLATLNSDLSEQSVDIQCTYIGGGLEMRANTSYKKGNRVFINCSIFTSTTDISGAGNTVIGKLWNSSFAHPSSDVKLPAVLRNAATQYTFPDSVKINTNGEIVIVSSIGAQFNGAMICGSYTV